MTGRSTATAVDPALATRLAEAFVKVYATLEGGPELFTEDVFFDVNVPQWRLQLEGPTAFTDFLGGYTKAGYDLTTLQTVPTAAGFVVELEGTYDHEGEEMYFRNLIQGEVRGERISTVVFYCTGDWDAAARAAHAEQVTLIRP